MKDRLFTGRDVGAALATAVQALGLPLEELRYVVLEREQVGGLGLSPKPARIAVLLDSRGSRLGAEPSSTSCSPLPALEREDGTLAVVEALSRALGRPLHAEYQRAKGRRSVRLSGAGCEALLDVDGRTLEALEHLLSRVGPDGPQSSGLRLECAGYREFRDEALRLQAEELSRAVLADGVARTTPPLNAYERRVIHMTVAERQGLRTFSLGEGSDRRVTVALAEDVTGL